MAYVDSERPQSLRPHHHFTIDVEEYFHPTALARHYPMECWSGLGRRSPGVIRRLLELLEAHGARGTFFILGWLAEQEPEMVREISEAGHEVASHGYEHELVGRLGPRGFRDSVARTKDVLQDLCGQAVVGYRAPSFSIIPGREWAFDALIDTGYSYDASLFPVAQHPTYGYPTSSKGPHWISRQSGCIAEFPATTVTVFGTALPASGGAYFRLFPSTLVRAGLRQAARRGEAGMFYLHPWELDDWTPDVDAPLVQRIRTFAGRRGIWERLSSLLSDYSFGPVKESFERMQLERSSH